MREQTNCPNCGQPITSIQCPYCGTIFYDFVNLDPDDITYIRFKAYDKIMLIKCFVRNVTINYAAGEYPSLDVSFDMFNDKLIVFDATEEK